MVRGDLQAEFGAEYILISAARSDTGGGLVIHNKQISATKMPMHFPDPFLINNVRAMNTAKYGGKSFGKCSEGMICQKFLTICSEHTNIFILCFEVSYNGAQAL